MRRRGRVIASLLLCLALPAARSHAAFLQYLGAVSNSDGPLGLAGAHGVAISPDGRSLYVAAFVDSALVVFNRDPQGGLLSYVQTFLDQVDGTDGLMAATAVVVSHDGADVYVASYFGNSLATFRREQASGALTFHEAFHDDVIPGLSSPRGIAISPDGTFVYVATYYDDSLVVFRRDPSSGALTHLQTLTEGVDGVVGIFRGSAVAVSPDGAHIYVSSEGSNGVAVFVHTGEQVTFLEAELQGSDGITDMIGPLSIAVSPDGEYVDVLANKAINTFRRDAQSGALTLLTSSRRGVVSGDADSAPTSISLSASGELAFVTRSDDDTLSVFQRSVPSGELSWVDSYVDGVNGIDGISGAHAVTVSPDERFVYVAGQFDDAVAVFRIGADPCAADCDGNALVVIEEFVRAIAIANGELSAAACTAADVDLDNKISAAELVEASTRSLRGCAP